MKFHSDLILILIIWSGHSFAQFWFQWSDLVTVLHMSWLSCHDMCKSVTWSDHYFNGLVQDCSIFSANALEILQPCTKPLILDVRATQYAQVLDYELINHLWNVSLLLQHVDGSMAHLFRGIFIAHMKSITMRWKGTMAQRMQERCIVVR